MMKRGVSLVFRHKFNPVSSNRLGRIQLGMKQIGAFSSIKQQAAEEQARQESLGPAQPYKKKLTEYQFNELVQMGTQQCLAVAETKLQQLQYKVQGNHEKLKDMATQMQYLQQHAEQIRQKEQILIQNIEEQERQLRRIKVRADKQVTDSKKYSVTKLALQLLEAADCINRCRNEAVKNHPDSKDPFIISIVDTQKKLVDILKTFDIEEFDPIGKQFDPNTQESLLSIPCPPGYTENTVATTMRTGYMIKGRLLRSARVGIFIQ